MFAFRSKQLCNAMDCSLYLLYLIYLLLIGYTVTFNLKVVRSNPDYLLFSMQQNYEHTEEGHRFKSYLWTSISMMISMIKITDICFMVFLYLCIKSRIIFKKKSRKIFCPFFTDYKLIRVDSGVGNVIQYLLYELVTKVGNSTLCSYYKLFFTLFGCVDSTLLVVPAAVGDGSRRHQSFTRRSTSC